MAITAFAIHRWQQTVRSDGTYNEPDLGSGAVIGWVDIANTPGANLPSSPNVGAGKVVVADKAALDTLDAATGVIVLAAVNDDGSKVAGYLRPVDVPTGAQLNAAKTRLQNAGIPTGTLTTLVTAGMTTAQVADALRGYAHDLAKDAQAQTNRGV